MKKKGTATIKPEEIGIDEEKMSELRQRQHDHYKNKTKTTYNPDHGVSNIIDVRVDPDKGISKKSKIEGDVDNTTVFDRKGYQDMKD